MEHHFWSRARHHVPNVLVSIDGRSLPQQIEVRDTLRTVTSGTLLVSPPTGSTVCGVEGMHWQVTERHAYEGVGSEEVAWPGLGGVLIGPTLNHLVSVGRPACNWSRVRLRGDTLWISRGGYELRYEVR